RLSGSAALREAGTAHPLMVPMLPRGNRVFGGPAPAAVDLLLRWSSMMVPMLPRGNRVLGAPAPAAVDLLLQWSSMMVPTLPRGNRVFGAPAPAAVDLLLRCNTRQCNDRRSGRRRPFPRGSMGTIRLGLRMAPGICSSA